MCNCGENCRRQSLVCALDLREPASAEAVVKAAQDHFGRIDAVLNIAGTLSEVNDGNSVRMDGGEMKCV